MSNETQIKRIKIQNFKGLKAYEGEVLGNDVYLTGKNASGKTSFIDAVWLALTGKNIPPKPVTTGAKKGLIEVELADGFIVRTKLATGKTPVSFEIENLNAVDEKDKFVKAPRTWLNERIGVIDFNVNDFFKMSDAKQVEYFCKITGVDVYELDQQIEENSDSRKFDKKKLVELQAKAGFFQPEEAEKPLVNVVELAEKITKLREVERVKAENWQKVTDGIADREQRIKVLKAEFDKIEAEVKGAYTWLDEAGNKPVPSDVLAGLENDFKNSEKINASIFEAKGYKEADEAIEKLQEAIQEATDGITESKDKKAVIISEKINIEGLSYDIENECFLFNALPFDRTQINTAAQLIAGLKIGASLLNEVKILKIDASLIDKENFEKVKTWSKSEGIELFVELVDREAGSLKIEIEENVSE
jgi:DNA repair exonuclease SbcCD ATPase subunit